MMTVILAILTLLPSAYLVYACSAVICRMSRETKWRIFLVVCAIACVGIYAGTLAVGAFFGFLSRLPVYIPVFVLVLALVMQRNPRIKVH